MKTLVLLACLMVVPAAAQTAPLTGLCESGGRTALTQGLNSTNTLLGIVPKCLVTVHLHNTLTLATIYSDSISTPLANPFYANAVGSAAPGSWLFYASPGQVYDVVMSNGASTPVAGFPNGPVTIQTEVGGSSTPYTLPIATTTVLGGVKPDGTSCTVSGGTGVLSCTGAGSVVQVNDTQYTTVNFNDTLPVADPGYSLVKWKTSGGAATHASAEFPLPACVRVDLPPYNAHCDNVTNDYTAISSAIASGAACIALPPSTQGNNVACVIGTGLDLQNGQSIEGNNSILKYTPTSGTAIICDPFGFCGLHDLFLEITASSGTVTGIDAQQQSYLDWRNLYVNVTGSTFAGYKAVTTEGAWGSIDTFIFDGPVLLNGSTAGSSTPLGVSNGTIGVASVPQASLVTITNANQPFNFNNVILDDNSSTGGSDCLLCLSNTSNLFGSEAAINLNNVTALTSGSFAGNLISAANSGSGKVPIVNGVLTTYTIPFVGNLSTGSWTGPLAFNGVFYPIATFGFTTGSNGNGRWVQDPTGTITERGSISVTNTGATLATSTITFPLTFPTAVDSLVITSGQAPAGGGSDALTYYYTSLATSGAGVTIRCSVNIGGSGCSNVGTSMPITWIAIGR